VGRRTPEEKGKGVTNQFFTATRREGGGDLLRIQGTNQMGKQGEEIKLKDTGEKNEEKTWTPPEGASPKKKDDPTSKNF